MSKWSCMADAFSMSLGIPFAQFIDMVGHDGSEQPYKDKTFYRGFHIQDCIDACFKLGYACTEIQAYYGSTPFSGSDEIIPEYSQEVCRKRFEAYINRTISGVLAGTARRKSGLLVGHAVSLIGNIIDDSRGYRYRFNECNKYNFQPQTLWLLTKMDSNYAKKLLES